MSITALGLCLNPFSAEATVFEFEKEIAEPMIYRRNLEFKTLKERPTTEMIVIHHTGMHDPKTKEPIDIDNNAEEIHQLHIEKNGWSGIGYHYLIRKDGMIEQGRPLDMLGAHVLHHNDNSIGISLAGHFCIAEPTEAQIQSVKALTAWLCQKYDLNPSKKGVIVGHRDLNPTTCPGDSLYSQLDEIREYCEEF